MRKTCKKQYSKYILCIVIVLDRFMKLLKHYVIYRLFHDEKHSSHERLRFFFFFFFDGATVHIESEPLLYVYPCCTRSSYTDMRNLCN